MPAATRRMDGAVLSRRAATPKPLPGVRAKRCHGAHLTTRAYPASRARWVGAYFGLLSQQLEFSLDFKIIGTAFSFEVVD
jgi:hypothetical protein